MLGIIHESFTVNNLLTNLFTANNIGNFRKNWIWNCEWSTCLQVTVHICTKGLLQRRTILEKDAWGIYKQSADMFCLNVLHFLEDSSFLALKVLPRRSWNDQKRSYGRMLGALSRTCCYIETVLWWRHWWWRGRLWKLFILPYTIPSLLMISLLMLVFQIQVAAKILQDTAMGKKRSKLNVSDKSKKMLIGTSRLCWKIQMYGFI